ASRWCRTALVPASASWRGSACSQPLARCSRCSLPSTRRGRILAVLSFKAAKVYLFAGLVPGLFAYSAYSYLGSAFGPLSTSLSIFLGPVIGGVLSIIFLGEAPTYIHLIGGVLSLGGMWLSLRRNADKPG